MARMLTGTTSGARAPAALPGLSSPWPLRVLLPELPSVTLTEEGQIRLGHGRDLAPEHATGRWPVLPPTSPGAPAPRVRVLTPDGELAALAEPAVTPGFLHPAVVLG